MRIIKKLYILVLVFAYASNAVAGQCIAPQEIRKQYSAYYEKLSAIDAKDKDISQKYEYVNAWNGNRNIKKITPYGIDHQVVQQAIDFWRNSTNGKVNFTLVHEGGYPIVASNVFPIQKDILEMKSQLHAALQVKQNLAPHIHCHLQKGVNPDVAEKFNQFLKPESDATQYRIDRINRAQNDPANEIGKYKFLNQNMAYAFPEGIYIRPHHLHKNPTDLAALIAHELGHLIWGKIDVSGGGIMDHANTKPRFSISPQEKALIKGL